MRKCIVQNCPVMANKKAFDDISFHTFPQDQLERMKWIDICKITKELPITKNSLVCSEHFGVSCFKLSKDKKRRLLVPRSLPTLFLPEEEIDEEEDGEEDGEEDEDDSEMLVRNTHNTSSYFKKNDSSRNEEEEYENEVVADANANVKTRQVSSSTFRKVTKTVRNIPSTENGVHLLDHDGTKRSKFNAEIFPRSLESDSHTFSYLKRKNPQKNMVKVDSPEKINNDKNSSTEMLLCVLCDREVQDTPRQKITHLEGKRHQENLYRKISYEKSLQQNASSHHNVVPAQYQNPTPTQYTPQANIPSCYENTQQSSNFLTPPLSDYQQNSPQLRISLSNPTNYLYPNTPQYSRSAHPISQPQAINLPQCHIS